MDRSGWVEPKKFTTPVPKPEHEFIEFTCASCGKESRAIDDDGADLIMRTHSRIHRENTPVSRKSSPK